ncbi:MAG: tetratricopeptide repeat protein [Chloroflexia bacterium]
MIRGVILVALVLVAVGLRLPGMVEAVTSNQAAVDAASACGPRHILASKGNRPPSVLSPRSAWFEAMEARCEGDSAGVQAAMRGMLAGRDARLDVIYATERYNVELARFAAEAHPERADMQFWLGDALAKRKDADGAIRAYEQGLALRESDANVWMTVGTLYEEKGDLQRAVNAYNQACHWVDRGANGCQAAGEVYLKLQQYEIAIARFEACIKQVGHTWPPSDQGIVKALLALGRKQEAIPHLEILAADGSSEARDLLNQIRGSSK